MVEHESGEAGASTWYPGEAGQVKKGGHILMKGDKPCKVIDIKVSKTGKHGHGKCRFTAIDIFDGSKHEVRAACTPISHGSDTARASSLLAVERPRVALKRSQRTITAFTP